MITGANDLVQIMGPDPTAPIGSSLSPADLARVQAENAALQIQSAKSNTRTHTLLAVGGVLALVAGVAYAVHKR